MSADRWPCESIEMRGSKRPVNVCLVMSRGLRDQKGSEKEKYGKTMPPNQVLRLIETMCGNPPVHVSHASPMHRAELRRM